MCLHCSTLVERGCMKSFGSCTHGKVVTWPVNSNQINNTKMFLLILRFFIHKRYL